MEEFFKDLIDTIKELRPRPDDHNSKSACSKCVGSRAGCSMMGDRDPSIECGAFAEIGKNVVQYSDGSKGVF